MELAEVLEYLRKHNYLLILKGKYSLSNSFQDDIKSLRNLQVNDLSLSSSNLSLALQPVAIDWPAKFIQFIAESKVPRQLESNRGETYAANKYSEAAMKIFRKAIEQEGVEYNLLVKSTILYYAGKNRFKKAIGNYFTAGDWKTGYEELKVAAESEETLKSHINDTIDTGLGGYRLG